MILAQISEKWLEKIAKKEAQISGTGKRKHECDSIIYLKTYKAPTGNLRTDR